MFLTDEERKRFADYLEQDAESTRAIIEQLKKLPFAVAGVTRLMNEREMNAELIVARKLRSVESVSIGCGGSFAGD